MKRVPSYKLHFFFLFFAFGFAISIVMLAVYGYHYRQEQQAFLDRSAGNYLENREYRFRSFIDRSGDQVLALATNRIFREFLEGKNSKESVTDLFAAIAQSNPSLMQVRYLDLSGKEVIRVNRDVWDDPVYIVPEDKLQQKRDRYYFQEAMKHAPGRLWYSPLDMNVEEKKMEIPPRPTIRIATLVSRAGKPVGMVIINLLMHHFLDEWRQVPGFDLYLVDNKGNLLLHPEERYDWSSASTVEKKGIAIPSYATQDPDFLYIISLYSQPLQRLNLILHVPKERQDQIWLDFFITMLWGTFALVLLAMLLAVPVARIPERLYSRVLKSNRILEERVDKKTAQLKELNAKLAKQVKEVVLKQEELKAAYENAARTASARSEFLGVVSHELRTPLNSVINFTNVIREDFDEMLTDPQLQEDVRLYLARTSANAKKLLELINNILDISRIESGNFSYHIVNTPLNALFSDAVERIKPKAEAKGLTIETSIPRRDLWAQVDSRRLFQVLLNLLANAVKFTDHGYIRLDVRAKEQMIEVLVTDTGRGIPEAMHNAIFHSFTQVDRFDEGTGLGLGLVKKICQEMKIRIDIESLEGEGSTFRLLIPESRS